MTFLERVCRTLNNANLRYAIVGGYAVALHGAVRGTIDIDIVLKWEKRQLESLETELNNINLKSRLPLTAKDVFNYRDEYINNRNLIAWNFYNPANLSEQLDVIITFDLSGREIIKKTISNTSIPILNKTDIIDMKSNTGRAQDIEDIKALQKL